MLARQIEEGAPADVFVSADEAQMNRLQNNIAPSTRCDLLTNTLVVIADKDSAQQLSQLSDLTKPEVTRIAIADPHAVPADDGAGGRGRAGIGGALDEIERGSDELR